MVLQTRCAWQGECPEARHPWGGLHPLPGQTRWSDPLGFPEVSLGPTNSEVPRDYTGQLADEQLLTNYLKIGGVRLENAAFKQKDPYRADRAVVVNQTRSPSPAPQPGDIWPCLETFFVVTLGRGAAGIEWVEDRGPAMHRTATPTREPSSPKRS